MNNDFNDQVKLIPFLAFLDHGWGHVLITKIVQPSHHGAIPTVKELSEKICKHNKGVGQRSPAIHP